MRIILFSLLCVLCFSGCVTNNFSSYERLIESDFLKSENYRAKESAKISISKFDQDESLEQLIEKSGIAIEQDAFKGYEVINFVVTYSGNYWLENYQVLRSCSKDICKHKFLLVVGVYA